MSMTTELVQRMKAAALNAKHAGEAPIMHFDERISALKEFQLTACPANVVDLVEALEARDKQIAEDVQIKARLCRESNSLFDRLRAAENRIAELEFAQSLHDEGTGMLCGQYDELAAAMGWTSELAEKQGVSQLEYARGLKLHIAELEARTVKLPLPRRKNADDYVDDTFEPCDLAAIYNACRLECEVKFKKALDAAGVAVEGE